MRDNFFLEQEIALAVAVAVAATPHSFFFFFRTVSSGRIYY